MKELERINKFYKSFYALLNKGNYTDAAILLDSYVRETNDEVNAAACLIDLSSHSGSVGSAKRGIDILEKHLESNSDQLSTDHKQSFYYNIGNGYMILYKINRNSDIENFRAFKDNSSLTLAKRNFNKAIEHDFQHPSLYTNYGNLLDTEGRSLEAIIYYDKALKLDPEWGMALGNKAISISSLANISGKYRAAQNILAYQMLDEALALEESIIESGGPQALKDFKEKQEEIKMAFPGNEEVLKTNLSHNKFNTDELSDQLKNFYKFSRKHDLFLNVHIQDNECESALIDSIFISLIIKPGDDDTFYDLSAWINEMKESYLTARYLLTEAEYRTENKKHISELTVFVYPLDYSTKNIYTGLLKSSIKESFSILDKIGHFMDSYLNLEISNKNKLSWKNFWFNNLEPGNPKQWFDDENSPLHNTFRNHTNYSLFAIFSLFLDIHNSSLPHVRNLITHKKIHVKFEGSSNGDDIYTWDELTEMTIQLLLYTKFAIIYLINFVNSEENKKRNSKSGLIMPIYSLSDQFI